MLFFSYFFDVLMLADKFIPSVSNHVLIPEFKPLNVLNSYSWLHKKILWNYSSFVLKYLYNLMHGNKCPSKCQCISGGNNLSTTIYQITTKITFLWVAFTHWMRGRAFVNFKLQSDKVTNSAFHLLLLSSVTNVRTLTSISAFHSKDFSSFLLTIKQLIKKQQK